MSGAEHVSPWPAAPNAPSAPAPRARRGLFRKYVLALIGLVAVALIVNAGVEFWFSYRQSEAALLSLQQEKANAAAQRIDEFVTEIERQIGWTTLPLWDAAPIEQRRFDFIRLLREVPAITSLSELDSAGKEQLKMSRLTMDVVGSGADFSHAPEFIEARAHGVWFGPVYFREQSEPYMILAKAHSGQDSGVTVAEINLKLIEDTVTGLKIGKGGYAYVVDRHGKLIADPDISRVLRDTDLSHLPQVSGALAAMAGQRSSTPRVTEAENGSGSVLSAHAGIESLGWIVFVEVPLQEAFAPLYHSAVRDGLWLVLALFGAALAGLVLARRMTGPIRTMQAGAARIGAGALGSRIDIHSGDELESLADQFNDMAGRLEASYADLENKVEERTAELSEALDQQTATAEVLGVINASPGDLAPVFETMLDKALRLCDAAFGSLLRYDGKAFHMVSTRGASVLADAPSQQLAPDPGSALEQLVRGAPLVHIPDLIDDEAYRAGVVSRVKMVEMTGARAGLWVALQKDDAVVGSFVIYRREAQPFSDRQIALLQNFAAQAVIAIENARLIAETREALEQQTATADVLGVINSSPGDLVPVFDAMLEKAMRLCEGAFGSFGSFEGGVFRRQAQRGLPAPLIEAGDVVPYTPSGPLAGIRFGGEAVVHIADLADTERYRTGNEGFKRMVDLGGARTAIWVALRKDETVLGVLMIYRTEIRPFTDKQIALLQNFAAQAVIAMENARLITETREALDQQTATAEVLGVINSSPGNLQPVFDAMLEKALALCGAAYGTLHTFDGELFHRAAQHGFPPAYMAAVDDPKGLRPGPETGLGRIGGGERIVHLLDIADTDAYRAGDPVRVATVDILGARTCIWVALVKDDTLVGALLAYRKEVRPFTDKQIALLQNFAAQAVIAMDNARLLDEIRQRQAELRVTFDNMADGVVMFDRDLRLAAWNTNFQEIVDLPDDFLAEPRSFADYIRYLAERGEFGEIDPEAEIARLGARFGEQYDFERTRPDGRVIEVRHNPMPEGGFVLIYSDITDRKRSEAEIRAARDAAERALGDLKTAQASLIQAEKMASLGQLTAGIAHEIKNPLNFVNNFASLSNELLGELKEIAAPALAALSEDARADLDETMAMLSGNLVKIAEHGKRADNIVKSMLEHSRGASGERRAVDLNGLVEEALNLAYHGARAQDQSFNITLERDFDAAVRPVELVPQDVTRVFLNLIGNGFHAAHKRQKEAADPGFRPVLKVSTHEAGAAVEIRVRDNGTGIRPEHRNKLFQPFFTTKPTGEGTGLGLSISYDIVTQQHGGTITVDSEIDAYTEFTVRLPRAPRAATTGARTS